MARRNTGFIGAALVARLAADGHVCVTVSRGKGDGARHIRLDTGMTRLSTPSDGRRPKSAKAGNRGKWGTGGAADAMGI